MGFSVCVSSEAATCSSLSSLLPLLWPSRPRLMPSTATATDSRTPTASPMSSPTLVFPSVLPLVWTPSPRVLTQGPLPVAHYYGKRSADPYYLGGYAVAGVPFGSSTGLDPITQGLDASTQGYAPYAYGHLGYGYGHLGYYGKRSADAEADPYYLGGYAYAGVPFGSSTGLDPITQGLDASTQGYAPYAYGHLGYAHGYLGHYYG